MFDNLTGEPFAEALAADTNGVLLDVRTAAEYAEGHLPNATNIDILQPDFSLHVMDLDPAKNYYVYCRSGGRSSQACMIMASSGISGKLTNLTGGILGWTGEIER
jgi:rhodanese-related sulfurtransferase